MNTLVGIDALQAHASGSVVTIGTFDGVHLGHRGLIMQTMDRAAELDAVSVAITWDRHPAATLRPQALPPLLTTSERKIELLAGTGIDTTVVLPFDDAFSQMTPEDFIAAVLRDGLATRAIFVGHDWRFGHKAAGDVPLLRQAGQRWGFEVNGVDLQMIGGEAVTSSRVRRSIAEGDLEVARVLLGRPYDVDGRVVKGAARGKDLGYPTANLDIDPTIARPPLGIYAGVAHVAGLSKAAAISVGTNPTFAPEQGQPSVTVEAYLLDFEREIYDETVRLEFWQRLRDEMAFDSVDALVEQMGRDVEETRKLVGGPA